MKSSEKKWLLHDIDEKKDIESIIESLLRTRKIDGETKKDFLHPDIGLITPKSVGIDEREIKKAVHRIAEAIKKQELIIVYGDYDVDGITGAAILWETLYELGANALPYIPHRVDEGYGLSEKGIGNLLASTPPGLIITVDNGIVAHVSVDIAKTHGIDVIITDHHLPETDRILPDALAIIHTTALCGSSVALLFAKEIRDQILHTISPLDSEHIVLAALATVADLVPLTNANRTILKVGLGLIDTTRRLGLRELLLVSGVADKKIGVYEIGHIISPRLNAAGRIESGMDSLRLLCTKDKKKAKDLAESLDETNKRRQLLMRDSALLAINEARKNQDGKKVIVIDSPEFEEGIIGLVAGKLVEEFYKPSIAIALRDEVSKGSVRSVSGVNIIEILRSVSDLFINVGGHPMAAGFTVKTENIPALKRKLNKIAEKTILDENLLRVVKVDVRIPLSLATFDLLSEAELLGPFGMGNPEPTFLTRRVYVRDKRIIGKDGTHVRFVISEDEVSPPLEAIAFGMAEKSVGIEKDDRIDLVYTLDTNTWNDVAKLQLRVRDFKRYQSS